MSCAHMCVGTPEGPICVCPDNGRSSVPNVCDPCEFNLCLTSCLPQWLAEFHPCYDKYRALRFHNISYLVKSVKSSLLVFILKLAASSHSCAHQKVSGSQDLRRTKMNYSTRREVNNPSMPVYASLCQSMPVYASLCQSMAVYASLWQSMPVYASLCQSMPVYASLCQSMPVYASLVNTSIKT